MNYSRVHMETLGYELPPVVVTSAELEARIAPVYEALRFQPGQLEALTGIAERRWWEEDYPLTEGAVAAGRKALEDSPVEPDDIEVLIYAGVCREQFEPATACRIVIRNYPFKPTSSWWEAAGMVGGVNGSLGATTC